MHLIQSNTIDLKRNNYMKDNVKWRNDKCCMHLLNCIVTSRDRINSSSILSVSSAAGEVKIDFVISLATLINGYLHFTVNKLERDFLHYVNGNVN